MLCHKSQRWEYTKLDSKANVQVSWQSNSWQVWNRSFTRTGFGCLLEKEKLSARDISSTTDIILTIPTVSLCGNKFQNFGLYFTMIQRLMSLGSSFYWERLECMRSKDRVLGGEEKTKLRGRGSVETIVTLKTDLTCLYL